MIMQQKKRSRLQAPGGDPIRLEPVEGACCCHGECHSTYSNLCQPPCVFLGEHVSCDGNPCITHLFPCCRVATGECSYETYHTCVDHLGGTTNIPCDDCRLLGACCRPDGTCYRTQEWDCNAYHGAFQGVGTLCLEYRCDPRACCYPDGSCVDTVPPGECTQAGGIPGVLGSTCETTLCNGACCIGGVCSQTTEVICNAASGVFYGLGSACAEHNCEGACCYPDGNCLQTVEPYCAGEFMGLDVPCDPNPCGEHGACCKDEECYQRTEVVCWGMGGYYKGDGMPCETGEPKLLRLGTKLLRRRTKLTREGSTCAKNCCPGECCPYPMGGCCEPGTTPDGWSIAAEWTFLPWSGCLQEQGCPYWGMDPANVTDGMAVYRSSWSNCYAVEDGWHHLTTSRTCYNSGYPNYCVEGAPIEVTVSYSAGLSYSAEGPNSHLTLSVASNLGCACSAHIDNCDEGMSCIAYCGYNNQWSVTYTVTPIGGGRGTMPASPSSPRSFVAPPSDPDGASVKHSLFSRALSTLARGPRVRLED